jgi:hypothetical protein
MKLALSILLFALCASAQLIPPMVQSSVVVQHKVPTPKTFPLSWYQPPSPLVASCTITEQTNGIAFASTNTTGTNVLAQKWPGTNDYSFVTIGTNGIKSAQSVFTLSGWYHGNTLNLSVVSNGSTWTNIVCADESTLTAPAFFRVAIGDTVVMQESPSLAFSSTLILFAGDIDNFPSIAAYKPLWIPYTRNIP